MSTDREREIRVLAIDPTKRGIGFAVLEGPLTLVDWGVKSARREKNLQSLTRTNELMRHYNPDVLVLEDWRGLRRAERIQRLIRRIIVLAKRWHLKNRCIPRSQVHAVFANSGARTKHGIARVVARCFPELAPHLPPYRRLWMNEDHRMTFFMAAALGLTFFYSRRRKSTPTLGR
jgi:hypothetical protein